MKEPFEIDKTHEAGRDDDGRIIMEICFDDTCSVNHLWSVYQHLTEGGVKWLSDHETFQLAQMAESAYEGTGSYTQDLCQQMASALMDCIGGLEDIHRPLGDYLWGNDRSQMYVDVALMARHMVASWLNHEVEGIIYEVSEAVAKACQVSGGPVGMLKIDELVELAWKEASR